MWYIILLKHIKVSSWMDDITTQLFEQISTTWEAYVSLYTCTCIRHGFKKGCLSYSTEEDEFVEVGMVAGKFTAGTLQIFASEYWNNHHMKLTLRGPFISFIHYTNPKTSLLTSVLYKVKNIISRNKLCVTWCLRSDWAICLLIL